MKRLLMSTALALVLAGPAMIANAQTTGGGTTPNQPSTQAPSGATGTTTTTPGATSTAPAMSGTAATLTQPGPDDVMGDDVIGMRVRNAQNENLGTINDLVIDKQGRVKAAVLSVGGFLGIGDKRVAVPWDQIQWRQEGNDQIATVNMTKDQLTQHAEFKARDTGSGAAGTRRDTTGGANRGTGGPAGAGGTGAGTGTGTGTGGTGTTR